MFTAGRHPSFLETMTFPLRLHCIGGQPPGDRLGRSPRATFERCDLVQLDGNDSDELIG